MDRLAVEQAKTRMIKARKSLQALGTASNYENAEEAWTDFLLAAATVYSKLEQGSKTNGASQGWYGRKKRERRVDPLLRYLHYSRNSDEHGIERVVERGPGSNLFGPLPFGETLPVRVAKANHETKQPEGEWMRGWVHGPNISLIRVFDRRFNDHCDPPAEHLGTLLKEITPVAIATLGLSYLEMLVQEAEGLCSNAR
ncbi:MAG: hypothetical protein K2X62_05060 [Beijerinckiaceae bacterium]|jgi:hypothetical protein|nr:hypothetical protein [Beijerinckiaceae bacterium]MBX9758481.1 hypothetical protein [Beijerinckiaceae bacterium]